MAHSYSQNLKGTGVALITPFNQNGEIDFSALEKLVQHQVINGTNYLVIMGTTGESPTISSSEKSAIIDCIKVTNNNKLPLVLGIGGNNTPDVVEQIKKQNLDGFTAILSVSPYYNKPNQKGIEYHYNAIADAAPLPIILYNVPGRTGSNISVETTLKLAEHPNILGTKEASGNFIQCMDIIKNKPNNFSVISGDDAYTLPFITLGMDGVISVICNAFPKEFSKMVAFALEDKISEARKIHYQLLDAMNLIFADGSPGGIKELLKALNICETKVRLPLFNVNESVKQQLLKSMNWAQ